MGEEFECVYLVSVKICGQNGLKQKPDRLVGGMGRQEGGERGVEIWQREGRAHI